MQEVFSLISLQSLQSEWVFVEIGAAWALGKHISPILLDCGTESLPSVLRHLQAKKFEKIEEVIDACEKRVSTEPDLKGEWTYNFYGPTGLLKYAGTCTIDEQEEWLHFRGTRKREMLDNGQCQEVTKFWASGWAAICPDGRIRAEYKLGNNNFGFMSLLIPPERPVKKISGEVYLLASQEFGNIEFIKKAALAAARTGRRPPTRPPAPTGEKKREQRRKKRSAEERPFGSAAGNGNNGLFAPQ